LEFSEEPNYDHLIRIFDSILESKISMSRYSYARPCLITTPEEIAAITAKEAKELSNSNHVPLDFT
jgi:hypothetical protein